MITRRAFVSVWGPGLTGSSRHALAMTPAPDIGLRDGDPVLDLVDDLVAKARTLDDRHGSLGAAFVGEQFAVVARLLRSPTRHGAAAERRLFAALAQLAQTAGFMAHEQAREGIARRWYLSGLRAARSAGDVTLAASILALMSNQATVCAKHSEALQLSWLAQQEAIAAPASVRALIHTRACLAHAGAGDLTGYQRARESGLAAVADTPPGAPRPGWTSYVDTIELDAIAGRALVLLADVAPHHQPTVLSQARALLAGRVDNPTGHERSALRHGALQAFAHTASGDLDQAVRATRVTVDLSPGITSVHCVDLLRRLHTTLDAHRHRTTDVKNVLVALERAIPA